MAELKTKTENVLNETRMLLLGITILLGFQFQSFFQKKFYDLPDGLQTTKLIGLVILLVIIGLLFAVAFYHCIVLRGNADTSLQTVGDRLIYAALLGFLLVLTLDVHTALYKHWNAEKYYVPSGAFFLIGLAGWYGYMLMKKNTPPDKQKQEHMNTPLKDKIKQVLTESRLVLPGIQALLGFQFAIFLMEKFDQIDPLLQHLHIAALFITLISIVLLMAPAAYHRIVLKGEDDESLYTFASRMVIWSSAILAWSFAIDVFIASRLVIDGNGLSLAIAAALLAFYYGLWFGFMYYKRQQLAADKKTTTQHPTQNRRAA